MKRRTFLKAASTGVVAGAYTIGGASCAATRSFDRTLLSRIDPGSFDGTWWNRQPLRLIQTNLREIDATMDVDQYVRSMVDMSANLVLLNVGGIVANYPTELEYHFRNPFMQGDLVGDLVSRLHAEGIRVMGRFDFSKINETLAARRPEWLYVSPQGENINYNGQVHVCPSRGYQQEYAFLILEEALKRYPLDAVFFNMPGYQTSDYSGNFYGQCQCEDCQRLFAPGSGRTRNQVAAELFERMHGFIRELRPDIAISTYTTVGVNMVATESGSSLSTAHEWNYSATDQVKRTLNSYRDLVPMNLVMGFLAIGYRHVATSPNIARVWQLQNMLHGGSLNYVFIGPISSYPDRAYVPILREIFAFHRDHAPLFTNVQSAARVALVRGSNNEYRGWIKLLSEEHIPFDVIDVSVIGTDRMPRPLEDYDTVILGDVRNLDDVPLGRVDRFVEAGGRLLATGFSGVATGSGGVEDPASRIRLECLGVEPEYDYFEQAQSTYLQISEDDRAVFGDNVLAEFDLMMMYGPFLKVRPRGGASGYMNLIPNTMFGPPEKCYFLEDEVTDFPGVVVNRYGAGRSVYLPWPIATQYSQKAHHAHRAFVSGALRNVLEVDPALWTNASPLIEVSHLVNRNGAFEWVGFINHSGQIGPTLGEPVPIRDTVVRLRSVAPVRELYLLRSGQGVDFEAGEDGWIEFVVPEVRDFEMALCLY